MTKFLVDGKERNLRMIDSNGIDTSNDFIGNTYHGMDHDEEGRYIASEEEYQWWVDMITAYEGMEELVNEYREKYGRDVDDYLQAVHAYDTDLEDQPSSVAIALEDYERNRDITTVEAAEVIGITESGVRRAILRGSLKAEKIGRDWLISMGDAMDYQKSIAGRPRKSAHE